MSFLLNLVPCCGAVGYNLPRHAPTGEETSRLVQGSGGAKKGYRDRKLGGGRKSVGGPPIQWRPSLCTISEEDVVKEVGNRVMRRRNVASKPNSSWVFGYQNGLRQQVAFQDLSSISPALFF